MVLHKQRNKRQKIAQIYVHGEELLKEFVPGVPANTEVTQEMLLRAGKVESITISRDKRIVQAIKNKSEKRAGKQGERKEQESKVETLERRVRKQVLKSPMPKREKVALQLLLKRRGLVQAVKLAPAVVNQLFLNVKVGSCVIVGFQSLYYCSYTYYIPCWHLQLDSLTYLICIDH